VVYDEDRQKTSVIVLHYLVVSLSWSEGSHIWYGSYEPRQQVPFSIQPRSKNLFKHYYILSLRSTRLKIFRVDMKFIIYCIIIRFTFVIIRESNTPPMLHCQPYARNILRDLAPPPHPAGDPLLPLFQGNCSKHSNALVLLPVRVPLCRRRATETHSCRSRQPQRPQTSTCLSRLCAPEDVSWWCKAPSWRRCAPHGNHGDGIIDYLLLSPRGIYYPPNTSQNHRYY
jgi:hypothetical protein